jgi:hypothetical protein
MQPLGFALTQNPPPHRRGKAVAWFRERVGAEAGTA